MKKLLLVLSMGFYLSACGGGGSSSATPTDEKVSLKLKVGSNEKAKSSKSQSAIETVEVVVLETGEVVTANLDGDVYVAEVSKDENVHVRAKIKNLKGNIIYFEKILKAIGAGEHSVDEDTTKVAALLINNSGELKQDMDVYLKEHDGVLEELDATVKKIESFDFIRDEVGATTDVQIASTQLSQAIAQLSKLQAILDKVQERLSQFENGTDVVFDGMGRNDFENLEPKIDNERLAQHILNANSSRDTQDSSESASANSLAIGIESDGDVVVKNNTDSVRLTQVISDKIVFGQVNSKTETSIFVGRNSDKAISATENSVEVILDLTNKVHVNTLANLSVGDYVSVSLKKDDSDSGLLLADKIYASGTAKGVLVEKDETSVTIETKDATKLTFGLALSYFEPIRADLDVTGAGSSNIEPVSTGENASDGKGKKLSDSTEIDASLLVEVGGSSTGGNTGGKGAETTDPIVHFDVDSDGSTTDEIAASDVVVDIWHPVYEIEIGDTVALYWSLNDGEKLVYQINPLVQKNAPQYFYGEAKLTGTTNEIMIDQDVIVINSNTDIYPKGKEVLPGSLLYVEAKLNADNQLVARYISISANYYFSLSGAVESVDLKGLKIGLLGESFDLSKEANIAPELGNIEAGTVLSVGGAIYADGKVVVESLYGAWRKGSFIEGNIQEIKSEYAIIGGVKIFLANLAKPEQTTDSSNESSIASSDEVAGEDVSISFVNASGSVSTSLVPTDRKKLSVGDYAVFLVEVTDAGVFAKKLNPRDDIYYTNPPSDPVDGVANTAGGR